jgi:putative peptidoglycan lipid II flippase
MAAHTVPSAATHGGGGWVTKLPVLPNAAGASAIALAATLANNAGAAALLILFRMTKSLPPSLIFKPPDFAPARHGYRSLPTDASS